MANPSNQDSSSFAKAIRDCDQRLIDLLLLRLSLVQEATAQSSSSVGGHLAEESNQIEQLVHRANIGTLEPDDVAALLRHAASVCWRNVDKFTVAFLGPEHSYSHLAAIKFFGEGTDFCAVASIPAVFESVSSGNTTTGLVPIENSTDGRIVDTLGMFVHQEMQICGEVLLPIHHNLLSQSPRNEIQNVYSKPQALSQCRDWLSKNLPSATLHEISSTTAAAQLAGQNPGVAAVASIEAGRKYGLDVIQANIEDNPDNVTRFAVLGKDEPEETGDDKTSLLFQVNHEPGALADVMHVFKTQGLNLTWIESFPAPGSPQEYLFFVELTGHRSEAAVSNTIDILNQSTLRLDVLGSYPIARG